MYNEKLHEKIFALIAIFFLFIVPVFIGVLVFVLDVTDVGILSGLIGAGGSVIGGLMTLIGVNWTLKNQYRHEKMKTYQLAEFIFTEFLNHFIEISNDNKSINSWNMDEKLESMLIKADELNKLAIELKPLAAKVDVEIYRTVKSIEYYSKDLINNINNIDKLVGHVDENMLMPTRNTISNLMEQDEKLEKYKRALKP